MNKDSFCKIGSTHAICQDYSLVGDNYAIVSDGCSGAPNTDLGSRFLSLIAEKNINVSATTEDFLDNVKLGLTSLQNVFNIDQDCLCATLLTLVKRDDCFETVVIGDGAIVAQAEDGFISVVEFEFESGAPYYMRYELDQNLKDYYMSIHGQNVKIKEYNIDQNKRVSPTVTSYVDFSKDNYYFTSKFAFNEWKTVGVISDGLNTFSCNGVPIPSSYIVQELFSFKSYNGNFVKRRCNKAFSSFKSGILNHYDDFSIAVLSNKE